MPARLSALGSRLSALGYAGSMREFLVDRRAQVFGFWHEHVGQALAFKARYPDRICMVGYERLREAPGEEIARIAAFLGLPASSQRIDRIIEMTDLERQKRAKSYDDPRKKHTLQAGRTGSWRDVLPHEDLVIFEGLSARVMIELGYPLSTPGTADPRGWPNAPKAADRSSA